ncbi:DUF1642 domain-containing protein [Streptococcus sp. A11]|uniref:DUF1642 domain-containing protein n=1 Tax=Streptococcus sp. A11 TaxID=3373124 RepID=UPI00374D3FB4
MNKHEVIKELMSKSREIIFGDDENVYLSRKRTIELVSQIHEPQKVVVPKVVATWIEYCKQSNLDLDHSMRYTRVNNAETGVEEWIYENQETFAKAWILGYEVEKERLYEVIVPGTSNYKNQKQYLVKQGKNWFFCGNDVNRFKYRFTKGQIEAAGFGWVFDCDGVKVVEVE